MAEPQDVSRDDLRLGLRNYWYPILPSGELPRGRPVAVQRLGDELVLWRDGDGVARVFVDRCPHRGVRLSIGDVVDGRLQCRYHGLQFDGTGQCRMVPFERCEDGHQARRMRAQALPCEERHGVIWAWIGDAEVFTPGENPVGLDAPELADPDYVWTLRAQVWNANWLLIHDNSADLFHVPFLHGHFATRPRPDGTLATRRLPRGIPLITHHVARVLASQTYRSTSNERGQVVAVREGAGPEVLDQVEFFLPCLVKVGVPGPFRPHKVRVVQYELALDKARTYAVVFAGLRVRSKVWRPLARLFLEYGFWHYTNRVFAEDSWVAENQGDMDECLAHEQLLPTDGGVVKLRRLLAATHAAQQEKIRTHRAARLIALDSEQPGRSARSGKSG